MSETTNRAIVRNGRLEPLQPITLPEGTEVIFLPASSSQQGDSREEAAQQRVFASLHRAYETGQTDLSERHNDHQP